ncbi:hypothetical protein D9Q98_007780 [Chlorella vulgaris]|uniref:alpha-1,2-Mannosidase n=1 Tax=Chlorella vulgaris TaxID=3077 RepID=A0A9D4YTN2_CHLVU|nr:hypothetical protein D9Q98_007780 [Chlorella vulgaris]
MRRVAGPPALLLFFAALFLAAHLKGSKADLAGVDAGPAQGQWQQEVRGGGETAAAIVGGSQDDSVRCRLSGICDGPHSECTEGGVAADPLACLTSDADRASAVQAAARHAWHGYKQCAWGEDELQPLSCTGVHWLNLSLTMVDSLDTLYLLGMHDEFAEAAQWLAERLDVGAPAAVNLFETTIRVLGGLLSAQALSAGSHPTLSQRLAEKAAELGARLLPAFDSPSGVPYSDVNLRTGKASMPDWGAISSLSEISSVSLEFTYLARITGHAAFERVPLAVHEKLERHAGAEGAGGLLGQYFNPLTGLASKRYGGTITLGACSDSHYEYLLKQWLLTGKTEDWLRQRYIRAMQSVRARLLKQTTAAGRKGLWYIAEEAGGALSGKMDHLVCFLPGLLALGDYHGLSTRAHQPPLKRSAKGSRGTQQRQATDMPDLELAAELAQSCYELYRRTPAGLAPEIAHFNEDAEPQDFPSRHVHDVGHGDFTIKSNDAHNLLRPESVESFYLLWKVTGDPQYKHWAWQVFQAIEKWAKVVDADREQQCAVCTAQAVFLAAQAEATAAEVQAAAAGAAAAATAAADSESAHNPGLEGGHSSGPQPPKSHRQPQRPQQGQQSQHALLGGGPGAASCSSSSARCPSCGAAAGGYCSLASVLRVPPQRQDKMESFVVAETLKYLYLIFVEPPDRCLHPSCAESCSSSGSGDGVGSLQQQQDQQQQARQKRLLPLDGFVFNTEAHPLPVVGAASASLVSQRWQPQWELLNPFAMPAAEAEESGSCQGAADKRTSRSSDPSVAAGESAAKVAAGGADIAADL